MLRWWGVYSRLEIVVCPFYKTDSTRLALSASSNTSSTPEEGCRMSRSCCVVTRSRPALLALAMLIIFAVPSSAPAQFRPQRPQRPQRGQPGPQMKAGGTASLEKRASRCQGREVRAPYRQRRRSSHASAVDVRGRACRRREAMDNGRRRWRPGARCPRWSGSKRALTISKRHP